MCFILVYHKLIVLDCLAWIIPSYFIYILLYIRSTLYYFRLKVNMRRSQELVSKSLPREGPCTNFLPFLSFCSSNSRTKVKNSYECYLLHGGLLCYIHKCIQHNIYWWNTDVVIISIFYLFSPDKCHLCDKV